jgi:hypothetical protein
MILSLILAKEYIKTSCMEDAWGIILGKFRKNDEIIKKSIDLNRQKWL